MSEAAPRKSLVLVVDDFADNREMYSEYLSFSGFDVIEARNGKEAIEAAQARMPDIIIMDLSLPVMDGWEATRRLKADDRTKRIPVVALTGHALAGHSKGARDAGCDSFLAKPCLPDQLVAEIKRMLESGKFGLEEDSSIAAKYLYMAARDNFMSIVKAAPRRKRLESLNLVEDVKFCLTPDQSRVIPVLEDGALVRMIY
jgi:CheY-like chemotaxis protein